MSCCSCCPPGAGGIEVPKDLRFESALPRDPRDFGAFDGPAGAEVFGRCAPAPEAGGTTAAGREAEAAKVAEDDAAEVAFIAVVVFVRGGGPGAVLDLTHPACLRLARIEDEGPIATYNEGASASRRLAADDFVVAVGGKHSDPRAMIAAIAAGGRVELDVRRPLFITPGVFDKLQGQLGLDLSFHPQGFSMHVREVFADGLVQANNRAHPEQEVRVGDLVTSINGNHGSSAALVKMIGSCGTVEMTFVRPHEWNAA